MTALRFVAHDVRGLTTVAHLLPPSRGRRGIYRLRYGDGTGYVGRTVDVVKRFAAHRRRHPDLVGLEFAPAPARADLAALEVAEMRAEEARGTALRNVVLEGQEVADVEERVGVDAARTAQGLANFRALRGTRNGVRAIEVARAYVHATVPRPRATEGTFWVASAMAATERRADWRRLVAISINKMETLVLGEDPTDPELVAGFVNVRRSVLERHYGSVDAFAEPRRDWIEIQEAGYEAAGGDGIALHAVRPDFAERLLVDHESAGVRDAARALNLMLMRKGASLQWRYHNMDLGGCLGTAPPDR